MSELYLGRYVGNSISNKLHLRDIQTRTNQTHHICNLLVLTRKDLRLIELATNNDVSWTTVTRPWPVWMSISQTRTYTYGYSYDVILGSNLIPGWVPDHSSIYLICDVLCCMVVYYLFRDKSYSIIFMSSTSKCELENRSAPSRSK